MRSFLAKRLIAFRMTGESSEFMEAVILPNLRLPSPVSARSPAPTLQPDYVRTLAALEQGERLLYASAASYLTADWDGAIGYYARAAAAGSRVARQARMAIGQVELRARVPR